jgi:hypothetical protein
MSHIQGTGRGRKKPNITLLLLDIPPPLFTWILFFFSMREELDGIGGAASIYRM